VFPLLLYLLHRFPLLTYRQLRYMYVEDMYTVHTPHRGVRSFRYYL